MFANSLRSARPIAFVAAIAAFAWACAAGCDGCGGGGDAHGRRGGGAGVGGGRGDDAGAAPDATCSSPKVFFRDIDGDGFGDPRVTIEACEAPGGFVTIVGDCDDLDRLRHPDPAADPGFVTDRCGMGRMVEPMNDSAAWVPFLSAADGTGVVAMVAEPGGCLGGGLAMTYDLPAPAACGAGQCAWTVMRKMLPAHRNLANEDYLLVPFGGSPGDPNLSIDFKLEDAAGCRLTWQIKNATDLPARRAAVVPLKFFSSPAPGKDCSLDLANVAAIEIGVVGQLISGSAFPDDTGKLHLDAITAVRADEIRMSPTFFECGMAMTALQDRIAADLLTRHQRSLAERGHSFVPSWFEETPNHYYLYNQALLLMVFVLEAERTGRSEYRAAATAIADQLVRLQSAIASGNGRWYDLYWDGAGGGLMPEVSDFSWFGNTAWVAIALDLYRDGVKPASPSPYDEAIRRAADWLEASIDGFERGGGAPGAITQGTEGNLSTFAALVSAGRFGRAARVRDYLIGSAWKADERRFWMGVDHPGLAIDVIGNWGADFLHAVGENEKALAGLGLAAGLFPVRSFDDGIAGLGDIAGPWQPALEFIGQYIAAGGPGATYLLQQTLALEAAGTFPGSPADFDGGDGWNTRWHGIAPAAWIYLAQAPSILGRLSLPVFAAAFEAGIDGFGTFEELVQPSAACYGTGIGQVAASSDFAASGTSSLRVSANQAGSTKSNHVIANRRIASDGQSGTWRIELDALVPADAAAGGQTGPEWSMQNTGEPSPGAFITRTAGIQYRANPLDREPASWALWAEASPGVARWKTFATQKLAPDTWYHFELVASYDTDRYVSLAIRGGGLDLTFDLSDNRIASESKLGFDSRAFWVSLEAENQWTCGAPRATAYRVYYDNLVVRR